MGKDHGETPQSIGKMGSEWFRDASVLVLVFGFLDAVVRAGGPPCGWLVWSVLVLALSGGLFWVGYQCETEWGSKK